MAEQFTGIPGKFVPLKETVRSFKEIIEGKHDDLPEQAFRYQGGIDDVVAAARKMHGGGADTSGEAAAASAEAATCRRRCTGRRGCQEPGGIGLG